MNIHRCFKQMCLEQSTIQIALGAVNLSRKEEMKYKCIKSAYRPYPKYIKRVISMQLQCFRHPLERRFSLGVLFLLEQ